MANALFLDFSIAASDGARETTSTQHRPTTVNVISDATGLQRDKLRRFFDGLVRLNDSDLRTVEEIVSRLAHLEEPDETLDEQFDHDNRRLRDRFIAERSPLRREDMVRLAQKVGQDSEAVLRRWEAEGDVFSVTHHGTVYYPTFQFRDGVPDPVVKEVLAALPPELSDWQRAFWFVSANGWVHNGAPADHLEDPALVLQAARYEGEPVVG